MLRFAAALITLCIATPALAAPELSGPLQVIDGDTMQIGRARIRLFGIDAPEVQQHCGAPDGPIWGCGAWASAEVSARYEGRFARCEALAVDRYGRTVGRCFVDGQDLGAELVASGLAFAYQEYSTAYLPAQRAAARRKAGLHATGVQSPQAYRKARRENGMLRQAEAKGCAIKGNLSHTGARIYHVPGQAMYERTRVSTRRGERWFCSERQAKQAGWRRAAD
ncbi:MAG: thermonuclease family protein [Pelagimonas sp.]|jgi:endonuclease YncB( thermonuclease family)|nr:thermonuclease family protein [Pelagimonas sp.]